MSIVIFDKKVYFCISFFSFENKSRFFVFRFSPAFWRVQILTGALLNRAFLPRGFSHSFHPHRFLSMIK